MIYIYIFLGIVAFKVILNICRYYNNKRLHSLWKKYIEKLCNHQECAEYVSYTHAMQENFKNSGVKEPITSRAEPIGMGYMVGAKYSAFDNIFVNDKKNAIYINAAFIESSGIYRERIIESFNPWFWIKLIVFLPKNIIKYLGLNTETIFTRIFQIIFWIVDSILLIVYKDEISIFVKSLFK